MGGDTDGTGMPTSKGWEVVIEPMETNEEPTSTMKEMFPPPEK
jgi:formylmethanofuran dehydrogenase subunit D